MKRVDETRPVITATESMYYLCGILKLQRYCVVQNAILRFWIMAVNVTPVVLCSSEYHFTFLDHGS